MMYEFTSMSAGERVYLLTRRVSRGSYEWQLYSASAGRDDLRERFGWGESREECVAKATEYVKGRLK